MNAGIHEKNQKAISNIKRIRTQKGYSQEYVAMKMKISQNTFSKLELGYVEISLTRFLQIADILEVDIDCLFETAGLQKLLPLKDRYGFGKPAIHRVVEPLETGPILVTNLSA
jgi:transcriptional regulator with XRE-family HTH domain